MTLCRDPLTRLDASFLARPAGFARGNFPAGQERGMPRYVPVFAPCGQRVLTILLNQFRHGFLRDNFGIESDNHWQGFMSVFVRGARRVLAIFLN